MRVTRAQAEENRERVIETAGQLFREKGFDGVGLNDLMKAAGLTRGGFYGQFESKLDLAVQALNRAQRYNLERWRPLAEQPRQEALRNLVGDYLSRYHQQHPEDGCALAALAVDAARQPEALKAAFTDNLRTFLDFVAGLCAGDYEEQRQQQAMAVLSTLVGALVLSRATDDADLARGLRRAASQAALEVGAKN
ncbi:TetR/AcrR family transcriptional regulator [Alcanivorax sp. 24]|uniref:TetR/AcrR family transcriptional regulator n=1 Tax=Alcanivorax sp. 24 TaxID=2545266 RepID=UPI00105D407E|nr:TetR/AcrR family transcriptional regulator [Alcanivorax sp. 24]